MDSFFQKLEYQIDCPEEAKEAGENVIRGVFPKKQLTDTSIVLNETSFITQMIVLFEVKSPSPISEINLTLDYNNEENNETNLYNKIIFFTNKICEGLYEITIPINITSNKIKIWLDWNQNFKKKGICEGENGNNDLVSHNKKEKSHKKRMIEAEKELQESYSTMKYILTGVKSTHPIYQTIVARRRELLSSSHLQKSILKKLYLPHCPDRYEQLADLKYIVENTLNLKFIKKFDYVSFVSFNILGTAIFSIISSAYNILKCILKKYNVSSQFLSQVHLLYPQFSQSKCEFGLIKMFSLFEMLSDQMDENSICHLLEYTKEKFNQFENSKPPSYETSLECSYYNFESVLFSESYHNGGQVFYLNPPVYNLSIQINGADYMYYCASVWSVMEGCYFEMYAIREGKTYFLGSGKCREDIIYFKTKNISQVIVNVYKPECVGDQSVNVKVLIGSMKDQKVKQIGSVTREATYRREILDHQRVLFSENEDQSWEVDAGTLDTVFIQEMTLYYCTTLLGSIIHKINFDDSFPFFLDLKSRYHHPKLDAALLRLLCISKNVDRLKEFLISFYKKDPNSHPSLDSKESSIYLGFYEILKSVVDSTTPYDLSFITYFLSFLHSHLSRNPTKFGSREMKKFLKVLLQLFIICLDDEPLLILCCSVTSLITKQESIETLEEYFFASKDFTQLLQLLLRSTEISRTNFYNFFASLLLTRHSSLENKSSKYIIHSRIFSFIERNIAELTNVRTLTFFLSLLWVFPKESDHLYIVNTTHIEPKKIVTIPTQGKKIYDPKTANEANKEDSIIIVVQNHNCEEKNNNNDINEKVNETDANQGDSDSQHILSEKIDKLDLKIANFIAKTIVPLFPVPLNPHLWSMILEAFTHMNISVIQQFFCDFIKIFIHKPFPQRYPLSSSFERMITYVLKRCNHGIFISVLQEIIDNFQFSVSSDTTYYQLLKNVVVFFESEFSSSLSLPSDLLSDMVRNFQVLLQHFGNIEYTCCYARFFQKCVSPKDLKQFLGGDADQFWNYYFDALDRGHPDLNLSLTDYLDLCVKEECLFFLKLIVSRLQPRRDILFTLKYLGKLLNDETMIYHFFHQLNGRHLLFSLLLNSCNSNYQSCTDLVKKTLAFNDYPLVNKEFEKTNVIFNIQSQTEVKNRVSFDNSRNVLPLEFKTPVYVDCIQIISNDVPATLINQTVTITIFPYNSTSYSFPYVLQFQKNGVFWNNPEKIPVSSVKIEFSLGDSQKLNIKTVNISISSTLFEKSLLKVLPHQILSILDIIFTVNPIFINEIINVSKEEEAYLELLVLRNSDLSASLYKAISQIVVSNLSIANSIFSSILKLPKEEITVFHKRVLKTIMTIKEGAEDRFKVFCDIILTNITLKSIVIIQELLIANCITSIVSDSLFRELVHHVLAMFVRHGYEWNSTCRNTDEFFSQNVMVRFLKNQIELNQEFYKVVLEICMPGDSSSSMKDRAKLITTEYYSKNVGNILEKLQFICNLTTSNVITRQFKDSYILPTLLRLYKSFPEPNSALFKTNFSDCVRRASFLKYTKEWGGNKYLPAIPSLLSNYTLILYLELANNHFQNKEKLCDRVFQDLEDLMTKFKEQPSTALTSDVLSYFKLISDLSTIVDQLFVQISYDGPNYSLPTYAQMQFFHDNLRSESSSFEFFNNTLSFTTDTEFSHMISTPLPLPISFRITRSPYTGREKFFEFGFSNERFPTKNIVSFQTHKVLINSNIIDAPMRDVKIIISEDGYLFAEVTSLENRVVYTTKNYIKFTNDVYFNFTCSNLRNEWIKIEPICYIPPNAINTIPSPFIPAIKPYYTISKDEFLLNHDRVNAAAPLYSLLGTLIEYPTSSDKTVSVYLENDSQKKEIPLFYSMKEIAAMAGEDVELLAIKYTFRDRLEHEDKLSSFITTLEQDRASRRIKTDSIVEIFARKNGLQFLCQSMCDFLKVFYEEETSAPFFPILEYVLQLSSFLNIPGYKLKYTNSHQALSSLRLIISHLGQWSNQFISKLSVKKYKWPKYFNYSSKLVIEQSTIYDPLIQLFTAPSTLKQISLNRKAAFSSGAIQQVILCMGHKDNSSSKNPQFFQDVLEKEKTTLLQHKHSLQKEDNKLARKSTSYWSKGTGYGTHHDVTNFNHEAFIKTQHLKAAELAKGFELLSAYLTLPPITQKLKTKKKHKSIDPFLPEGIYEIFDNSPMFPIIHAYIRNDSLLEMMKFYALYSSILGLLDRIAHVPSLLPLLFATSEVQSSATFDLLRACRNMANIAAKTMDSSDSDRIATFVAQLNSLFNFLEEQYKRANNNNGENGDDHDDERKQIEKQKKEKKLKSKERLLKKYMELKDLQFDECASISTSPAYHYKSSISTQSLSKHAMERLIAEMSSLSSNLPLHWSSSVFLRVDPNNIHAMQALITGPRNTPYHNGCFLFDIYCGGNFPVGPPLVNLRTTGHGTVRFNPNLYNCGKVCLSLLGTWQGSENEKWKEDTSSLLQVFVSIQALIFVEQPYFNEPSYERWINNPIGWAASKNYNDNLKPGTIQFAMTEMILHPPAGFEEVVKTHFTLKRKEIRRQVAKWDKEQIRKKKKLKDAISALHNALDTLPKAN